MSLQTRIASLITAIGADIKALQNRVDNQYIASTANQTLGTTDTYLNGSRILIPQGKIKAGTKYRCKFNVVKTAAGIAGPIITVRVGTLGTISDSSRASMTWSSQTAVADDGLFEIECVFRQAGSNAVIQAWGTLIHKLVTTGLNITAVFTSILNTGAAFDITGAGLGIGISVNAGASSAWTVSLVAADLVNLTP